MTKEIALELQVSANVYLTEDGKKLLEKVVSVDGESLATGSKV